MDHGNFVVGADQHYNTTGGDSSLDELFDSFSSGASDGGAGSGNGAADYSFDSEMLSSYLSGAGAAGQQQGIGAGGVAGYGGGGGGGGGGAGGAMFGGSSSSSSAADLSNASSPGYAGYPATGNALVDGSSPPFSFGAGEVARHQQQQQHLQHTMYNATGSASYYANGDSTLYRPSQSSGQPFLAAAPQYPSPQQQQQQHHLSPNPTYQPQQNHFTHFTPQHSATSLSPPSSASSSNGGYQGGYPAAVPAMINSDADMARLMAGAEGTARSQAEAQAAFASSYMASLQSQAATRQGYLDPADGQQPVAYHESVAFASNNYASAYAEPGAEKMKKRRVSSSPEESMSMHARSQPKSRGTTSGTRRAVSSNRQQQLADGRQDGFHLAMNAGAAMGSGGNVAAALAAVPRHAGAGMGAADNPLNLIAMAGVPMAGYRDDSNANQRTIAPSSVMQEVSPQASAPAPATRGGKKAAAVEKAAGKKAAGGAEKRKKGEKGHNAVERRYRNNINNHLAALRDAIPALRHLKPLPSMPASRRRASQFTLSTAAQGPTPAGLVDGVLAAKTLSKGSILGKSIEYIHYLQGARADGAEDIEIFKTVVLEMVGGGQTLVDAFEERRAVREVERARIREEERKEQERLDEEDGSGAEEEEDEDKAGAVKRESTRDASPPQQQQQQESQQAHYQAQQPAQQTFSHVDGLAQLRQHLASTGSTLPPHLESFVAQSGNLQSGSPNGFPPSPVSSSEDPLSISPRLVQNLQYRNHAAGPPRMLLATFMGLSFAGGLGYDWTYNAAAEAAGDAIGARAWAGRLVRRGAESGVPSSATPSPLVTSDVIHPSFLSGLVFLGIASILGMLLFVAYPLFVRQRQGPPAEVVKSRGAYRQRRRAQALAALAHLNHQVASAPTYLSECQSALKARRELLKLVGAPTYGLLPALCKEGLATLLRKVTTIRVGTFTEWSQEDRVEAAVAWVRIAEIEATVGADEINYLARCYTFLRLFNLSRSKSWPQSTSSTALPAVDAVLAIHLLSLGQPLSAAALWTRATRADRKKSDTPLHPWAEIALTTNFSLARSILSTTSSQIVPSAPACPSDTVPLLRISEVQCAAALREAWAKIFTSVVATTCPPHAPLASLERFSVLVDQPFLEETIQHVLESTVEGAAVHTMGKVTRSLCRFYAGEVEEARALAREVERERSNGGPARRLRCVEAFLKLVLDISMQQREEEDVVAGREDQPSSTSNIADVDFVASSTLGWLLVRRQVLLLPVASGKAEPQLHHDTLAIRRMLGHDVFRDESLRAFCSPPLTEGEMLAGGEVQLDFEGAVDACLDALTGITRRAAGLRAEDDSGVECD